MELFRRARELCLLVFVGSLLGCSGPGLGSDGAFHPDMTASFANYTGHGDSGTGWTGDDDSEKVVPVRYLRRPTTKSRIEGRASGVRKRRTPGKERVQRVTDNRS